MARRVLSVLAVFLVSSAPLVAQGYPAKAHPYPSLIAHLWHAFEALTGLNGPRGRQVEEKGRGALDPNGLTAPLPTDGRGACDPDGLAACGS